MKRNQRIGIVLALSLVMAGAVFAHRPIPQNPAYHRFVDGRAFLGVPNCLNVLSNLPFLIVGLYGVKLALGRRATPGAFSDRREHLCYAVLFLGVALTSMGSSYYHLAPDDARLFWDRLPMSVGFMGLFAAIIAERIDVGAGWRLLPPLLIAGACSLLYWRWSGDLRAYVLVQFYPLLAIPVIMALFPPRYTRGPDLLVALGIYVVAKLFEVADADVFHLGGIVSGHTLKHLTAAAATYWILRMLRNRVAIATSLRVSASAK